VRSPAHSHCCDRSYEIGLEGLACRRSEASEISPQRRTSDDIIFLAIARSTFVHPANRNSRACCAKAELTSVAAAPGVLIICIVGAICFLVIDKFVNEARLANLLELLVVLICLAAILQRVLPLAGINWLSRSRDRRARHRGCEPSSSSGFRPKFLKSSEGNLGNFRSLKGSPPGDRPKGDTWGLQGLACGHPAVRLIRKALSDSPESSNRRWRKYPRNPLSGSVCAALWFT
jgi:hypothetical protein